MDASLIFLSKIPVEKLEAQLQIDRHQGQARIEKIRQTYLGAMNKATSIYTELEKRSKNYLDADVISGLHERQTTLGIESASLKARLDAVKKAQEFWQQEVDKLTTLAKDKESDLSDVRRKAENAAKHLETPASKAGKALATIVYDRLQQN